ncbi:MAG TPA: Fe-S cluster assembly protein SufD [Rhodanobacteraceae bacterium]|nr:Fe-S cluster assembly protein SufD [Rhodanobacteraceae bacterium]
MSAAVAPFVESMHSAALPASGIGWLDAARRDAMQAFLAAGLPTARNELWKYTALRALERRSFGSRDESALTRAIDEGIIALPGVAGPRLVFVNGVFRADLSRLQDLPEGLSLRPLSHALAERPEPLRFALSRQDHESRDAYAALNLALATEGVVLNVAEGARIEAPVHLVHVGMAAEGDVAWHARNLIELGAGSQLKLIEHHAASGEHAHFANLASEMVLREGAQLDLLIVQDAADKATLLRRSELRLHEDARARLHALELGGALARHEVRVALDGDRSRVETRGAFALRGRQHADTELLIEHRGRDTGSAALWRGVADDRARGVFHGAITVHPGADGSDARLSNKNLLLSSDAEIDTRPALEIYADEVKAAHGATVGQLDERALFYLRSRGVPAEQARMLLVRAFCAVALGDLEPQPLREHCDALLLAHLPREDDDT